MTMNPKDERPLKIKTLILDDEYLAVRVLEKYVRQNPLLELAATFTAPLAAFAHLQEHAVDLILLDIDMPELSGLAFVRSLSDPPKIIFTTAYPEYAVEGFELEAVDYLVKPIAPERFLKAIEKVHRLYRSSVPAEPETQHLLVRADRKIHRLPLEEILYLQAYGDYVKIVCRHKTVSPKEKLGALAESLPPDRFLRVHRSYIIAIDKIEYMEGNQVYIGGQPIPVAQSSREDLLGAL